MARAISNIETSVPNQVQEQAQAIQQLLTTTAKNADALVVFLDILNEMHKLGLLEAVKAMLQNRHDIARIAVTQMNQPGMHHVIKNAMGAMQFLGKIEPEKMQTLLDGVASGIQKTAEADEKEQHIGMWSMMKMLKDPEIGASLSMAMNFMRGMGESLSGGQKVH